MQNRRAARATDYLSLLTPSACMLLRGCSLND